MRKVALLAVAIVAAIIVSTSVAGSTDQGRRLSGPFCVSLSTGVVRAIAEIPKQACRPGEVRKLGVAIPCKTLTPLKPDVYCVGKTGPAGKTGATGPAGKEGAPGVNGKDGAPGAPGANGAAGAAGKVTVTQLSNGCARITGSDGSYADVCAPPGAPGPKGDKGDPGDCNCCPIKQDHKDDKGKGKH